MIPQSFIQDLLARVDIVDVVGRYVQLKKGGQNFLGLCPFHGEKSPSFTVSPSKQFYHCFGCGVHGSAIGFLMEHRGLGYVEAIRELAQQAGLQVPESSDRSGDASGKIRALTDLLKQAADYYRAQLRESPSAIEASRARRPRASGWAMRRTPGSRCAQRPRIMTIRDWSRPGLSSRTRGNATTAFAAASCSRSAIHAVM
jgi:DNA primase